MLSILGADRKEIQKQKWRDLLKRAIIKTTDYCIFVLLGVENQSEVHYAMPVTMKQKLSDSQKSANYPYQTFNRPF